MREPDSTVIVIDDDPSFLRSTERLIRSAGFRVRSFAGGTEFLHNQRPDGPACLVLDVRMPGLSGLDVQQELARTGVKIPTILITGHGDIPMAVQGMKCGAVDFLTKPFREQALLDAIGRAIERDRAEMTERECVEEERRRLVALVNNSTDFIGFATLTGEALFINAAGQAIVGLEGNERARETKFLDCVAEQDRRRLQNEVLPALFRDGSWAGETLFRNFKTGDSIPMWQHLFFITDEGSGRRLALATISRDITKRKGAEDALKKAFEEIRALKDQLAQEKLYLEEEIRTEQGFEDIIGQSKALRTVLGSIEKVAPTDSSVLIQGETGAGKELIARAIHNLSPRRARTFIKLNCAAIPLGLLESELFGHEKGAFTGAIARKIGRFELAHGGTLFLDEVGDIPLELQPKLLRVLQDQEFERLGGTRTQRVDVRLVAATNRDLAQMVAANQFRSDLYYRLNVFPIRVPPLRERPEDIPLLVRHFTSMYARRMRKQIDTIPGDMMKALTRYPWPGNVRELQNLIERAVILSPGPVLHPPLAELTGPPSSPLAPAQTLEDAERAHILRALEDAHWVVGGPKGAAARLGLKRTTLLYKMDRFSIPRRPR
jgi:PAS domain S-box-containing protein